MKYLLNNDYLSESMITYIQKTRLVYYKKFKHFTLFGYFLKKNDYFILCGKRIQELYQDLFIDFNIQLKHLKIVIIDSPQQRKFIDHEFFINGGLLI